MNVNFEAMKREELKKILRGKCVTDEACEEAIDELLNLNIVSYRRELLKGFMMHIEKDGAISFRNYDWTIRLFEEDNKTLL